MSNDITISTENEGILGRLTEALDKNAAIIGHFADTVQSVLPAIDQSITPMRGVSFSAVGPVSAPRVAAPKAPEAPEPPKQASTLPAHLQPTGITYSSYIPKTPTTPATDLRFNPALDAALGLGGPTPPVTPAPPSLPPVPPVPPVPPSPPVTPPPSSPPAPPVPPVPPVPPTPPAAPALPPAPTLQNTAGATANVIAPLSNAMRTLTSVINRMNTNFTNFNQRISNLVNTIQQNLGGGPGGGGPGRGGGGGGGGTGGGGGGRGRGGGFGLAGATRQAMQFFRGNIIFTVIGDAIRRLTGLVQPIAEVVSSFGDAFQPVIDLMVSFMRVGLSPLVIGFKALSTLLSYLLRPFQILADEFLVMIDTVVDIIDTLDMFGRSQKLASDYTRDAFKNIRDTVKHLITDPFTAIPSLIGHIQDAVNLFNPGAMIEFELALRDAKAVFGEALLPIVRIATEVVRRFADTIRPILQKLQPQFEKLVRAVGDHLIRNVDMLATAIERMIPLIERYMFYQNQSMEVERRRQAAALQAADPLTVAAKRIAEEQYKNTKAFNWGNLQFRTPEARLGDVMRETQKKAEEARKGGDKAGEEVANERLKALDNVYKQMTQQGKRFDFLQKIIPEVAAEDEKYQAAQAEFMKAQEDLNKAMNMAQRGNLPKNILAAELKTANKKFVDAEEKLVAEMGRLVNAPGPSEGLAAPMHPAFKSIADLTRETMLASFLATSAGAGEKEKQDDNARRNVAALPQVIFDAIVGAFGAMKDREPAAPGDAAFPRGAEWA